MCLDMSAGGPQQLKQKPLTELTRPFRSILSWRLINHRKRRFLLVAISLRLLFFLVNQMGTFEIGFSLILTLVLDIPSNDVFLVDFLA